MFKKPFKTRSSILKGSDRKKLKEAILKCYPELGKDDLDDLIPQKGDSVTTSKVLGTYTIIYSVDNEPMFFDLDSRNTLYPTVYCLWKLPPFMPVLAIHPATFTYISQGADLMLPGVILPKEGLDLLYNRKAMIVLAGYNIPVAVGHMATTLKITERKQLSGKGLIVQHFYSDNLWASGSKKHPQILLNENVISDKPADISEDVESLEAAQNQLASSDASIPISQPSDNPDSNTNDQNNAKESIGNEGQKSEEQQQLDNQQSNTEQPNNDDNKSEQTEANETQDSEMESGQNISIEEMDALIKVSFFQAIKKRVKQKDLPLLASVLWSDFVLPCRPKGSHLNIKKSSWKKFLAFLEEMTRGGIICIDTTDNGVTHLVAVVRDHPTLANFRTMAVSDTMESEYESEDEEEPTGPIIEEFWTLHKKLEFLLPDDFDENFASSSNDASNPSGIPHLGISSRASRKNKDLLKFSLPDITALLWNYVATRQLQATQPKFVQLDLNLASSLYPNTDKQMGDLVEKKDLALRFKDKIIPIQVITTPSGEQRLEKGQNVGSIKIVVETRGGSKITSRIQGLHHFGLEPKVVGKKASKKFASSAGYGKDPHGHEEILLQGNLEQGGPEFIASEFNIPLKYIKVEVNKNVKRR